MSDIALPSDVLGRLQEPGRQQIVSDLMTTARQLINAPDDSLILAMVPPTRKFWVNILIRMKAENPQDIDMIERLIKRFEATL